MEGVVWHQIAKHGPKYVGIRAGLGEGWAGFSRLFLKWFGMVREGLRTINWGSGWGEGGECIVHRGLLFTSRGIIKAPNSG